MKGLHILETYVSTTTRGHFFFPVSATRSQEGDENSLSILSLIALLVLTVTMMGLLGHKLLSGTIPCKQSM